MSKVFSLGPVMSTREGAARNSTKSSFTRLSPCIPFKNSVKTIRHWTWLAARAILSSEVPMSDSFTISKKPPMRASVPPEDRLLVGRRQAAQLLSISERSLDYLLANQQLHAKRIASRVLIAVTELERYARADHPPTREGSRRNAHRRNPSCGATRAHGSGRVPTMVASAD